MTPTVTPQTQYDVKARRISGTHTEKLEQIDAAIQELLEIKLLECAADRPGVHFIAAPRPRRHGFAMTITILILLIVLVLLVGVRTSRAQPPAGAAPGWHLAGTIDASFLNANNDPENHLFRTRGTTPKVDEWGADMAVVAARKSATDASSRGMELSAQTGRDADTFGVSPTAPNLAGGDWLRRRGRQRTFDQPFTVSK